MPALAPHTVYTKTAKGILWTKRVELPHELHVLFEAIDGKASTAELLSRLDLSREQLQQALDRLLADGFIKPVSHPTHAGLGDGDTDLDFTEWRDKPPFDPDAPLQSGRTADTSPDRAPAAPIQAYESSDAASHATVEPPEGGMESAPAGDTDMAERVRELNARVRAERQAREGLRREGFAGGYGEEDGATWPALQLSGEAASAAPAASDPLVPQSETGGRGSAAGAPEPQTPEHVPTALERAMAELAARRRSEEATAPAPTLPAAPRPAAAPHPVSPSQPTGEPTLEDEPLHERLNVDRAAYDLLAESAEAERRAEGEKLGRDAELARRRLIEEDERRARTAARQKRRSRALVVLVALLVGAPIAALLWLQFGRLNAYIPDVERALTASFGQPVSVAGVRYVLLPTPRLVLEDVRVGKPESLRAERVETPLSPLPLLQGTVQIDSAHVTGLTLDAATLGAVPLARASAESTGPVRLQRLRLTEAKLNIPGWDPGALDGQVTFTPAGAIDAAELANAKTKIQLTPRPEGLRVGFEAYDWRLPFGPPVEFSRLVVSGLVDSARIAAAEYTGRIAGGDIEGAFTARWGSAVSVQGEFNLQHGRLQDLASAISPHRLASGTINATGRFKMAGRDLQQLQTQQLDARFNVARGELTNLDLVRVIQSPGVAALGGGRTGFDRLTGALHYAGGRYEYRQLELTSGPLNASGQLTVAPAGALSGRMTAELAGQGGVVARSVLVIGGSVRDPQLRR